MNGYNSNKKVPIYNQGRFIFMFDPKDKLSAVYDSKYSHIYTLTHIAFIQVFGAAVDSLNVDALRELKEKLKDEYKYSHIINTILYNKQNM